MMAHKPDGPLWIFAFGSLMWNPCFSFDKRETATIFGWERKFHFWTILSRGSPEFPGLGLCLEKGIGNTSGVAYRLKQNSLKKDLNAIWSREMGTGVYCPFWVKTTLKGGGEITALTFIINRKHEQYSGPLPINQQAKIIAAAKGKYGSCREYLANTVESLNRIGVNDDDLSNLLDKVDSFSFK